MESIWPFRLWYDDFYDAFFTLGMLTHNSTGARIGNDVIMPSTEALYLLHLPKDVLAYIPLQGIENSPLGNAARGGNWFENFVVGVANFIWNGIVSVARFILDLGVAMIKIGLIIIDTIVRAAAQVIAAVVDAIVDAFLAFLDWVIEFIGQVVNAVFGPIIQKLNEMKDAFFLGMQLFSGKARGDIASAGGVAQSTLGDLANVLFGDFFVFLLVIATIASVVFTILKVVTNVFGFLLSMAITMIAGVLIGQIVSAATGSEYPLDGSKSGVTSWMESTLGKSGRSGEDKETDLKAFEGCWGVFGLIPEMAIYEATRLLKDARNLALSVCITMLAFANIALDDIILDVLALGLSGLLFIDTIIDIGKGTGDDVIPILALVVSGVGLSISFTLLVCG